MPAARSSKVIRAEVSKLLARANIHSIPVSVDDVALHCGAIVRRSPFEGELAGMLVLGDGAPVIGVNNAHPINRQRFTIAHEIGHLVLHGKSIGAVHVDKSFRVMRRDSVSSTATDFREIESNRFAAELLMPYDSVVRDIEEMIDIESGVEISRLATKYQVSDQAMTFRINNVMHLQRYW